MATQKSIKSEDDILKVRIGPDATATFDNSPSNPTEHAGSENLRAPKVEEDDLEEEDEDEEEDDFDDDDEDDDDEDEIDAEEDYEDEGDDEEDEEEDHDLATGPKAPSVYRKL